jgi:hypothetical protein
MLISYTVLIGYANGDVHSMQVNRDQQASQIAAIEAQEIGTLTNAGFRTVVASAWMNQDEKTAGFLYAAAWNGNEVELLLHHGDRIASSQDLFLALESPEVMTAQALLDFCRQFKAS